MKSFPAHSTSHLPRSFVVGKIEWETCLLSRRKKERTPKYIGKSIMMSHEFKIKVPFWYHKHSQRWVEFFQSLHCHDEFLYSCLLTWNIFHTTYVRGYSIALCGWKIRENKTEKVCFSRGVFNNLSAATHRIGYDNRQYHHWHDPACS